MKKSELRKLIKEEISKALKEEKFDASGYDPEVKLPVELFEKLENLLDEFLYRSQGEVNNPDAVEETIEFADKAIEHLSMARQNFHDAVRATGSTWR